MEYSYYPGCSLHATAREYSESALAVLKAIKISDSEGVVFEELDNWNCCGALETTTLNHTLAMALPARNLALAAKFNRPLAVLCSACFFNHQKVNKEITESEETRSELCRVTNSDVRPVVIKHFLDIVVRDIGLDHIAAAVKNPLRDLRVAPYYGCALLRPSNVTAFDDHHNPSIFESLIRALGGNPVNYPYKTKCCGGSLVATNEEITYVMTQRILDSAKQAGAECIVTACPLCELALESIYLKEEKRRKEAFDMPIFYFTQLMGIAFGLPAKEIGLHRNFVDNKRLLGRLGVRTN